MVQLAKFSIKVTKGLVENILIKVQNCYIPIDFLVLDMAENLDTPIILGRPFMATAGAKVDVQKGILSFQIRRDKLRFDILQAP